MRWCHDVIDKMLEHIPEDKIEFKNALKWNREDSLYKAPEETLQWERTTATLEKYIPTPELDWEFEVLSVFTTKPKCDLKEMFRGDK